MTTQLPHGYTLRAPTMEDAQAATDLITACDLFESGFSDFTLGRLLEDWNHADLGANSWVVVAPDGRVVGLEDVFPSSTEASYELDGYVHPEHMGLGIGSLLVGTAEGRVRDHATAHFSGSAMRMKVGINAGNEAAHQLFRDAGFAPVRYFWRMERHLAEQPPAPHWPQGLTVRSFVPEQDERAIYTAVNDAFLDHWDHTVLPFEEWIAPRLRADGYDPSLWFLVFDGDEPAAAAMCYNRGSEGGWVRALGVRRPWRRAGIGMALLLHAFGVFRERGRYWVGLGVDAANPTGATRLYERAGMRVVERYATYEKVVNSE